MGSRLAVAVLACVLAAPAHALDPLSLFVLRMLRDAVLTAQLESAFASPAPAEPRVAGARYPGDLRAIVDQGFPHLDVRQRDAVYEGLRDAMNDPAHAADRDAILNQFVATASAARQAHSSLARLSDGQKRTIAAEAAAAYRHADPKALQEAIGLLQSPAVPLPADLRALMLAEFSAVKDGAAPH